MSAASDLSERGTSERNNGAGRTVTVLRPRLAPAPSAEPPYDTGSAGVRGRSGTAIQGTLALTFTLPSGVPATPAAWLRLVPPPADPAPAAVPERPAPPNPRDWAGTLAQAVVEVLAGERPVGQLTHWTTPRVYAQLARRAAIVANRSTAERTAMPRIVLRRVHVGLPAAGVVEASTVIHGPDRARALAFRLEETGGRWLCTVLELG
jgi:hypothetical protein